MILEGIFNIFFSVLHFLINLLPTSNIFAQLTGVIQAFFNLVTQVSFFFPVGALLECIAIIVAFQAFMWGVVVIEWVIKRIPFIG